MRFSSNLVASLLPVAFLSLAACSAGDDPNAGDPTVDANGDELAGSSSAINVGSDSATTNVGEFAYLEELRSIASRSDARLCHTYTSWDVALHSGDGDPALEGSRAALKRYLQAANGVCDEVLISFKASNPNNGGTGREPGSNGAEDMKRAFSAFRSTAWGFSGNFAFTPWNEPNNGAGSGNGLGHALTPHSAARYYLAIRSLCKPSEGCKVAAGDMASNGVGAKAFVRNCANDNVAPNQLCSNASYLDKYKNYIANHANDGEFGLGSGFRPEYFAFHGWSDVNDYLAGKSHCDTRHDCVTRAVVETMGGSWGGVELWDTEVGSGQDGVGSAPGKNQQACGAAFLLKLSTISRRLTRIYYTRMHGGAGELFEGPNQPRPAGDVIARRETSYSGSRCF